MMRNKGVFLCWRAFALAALLAAAGTARPSVVLLENLGNFPDAIEVSAQFGTFTGLVVNSASIPNGTAGLLFRLSNTSYCLGTLCGGAAAFEQDPDGGFAVNDVLTATARQAITARQPFGIYRFGALLPTGSGVVGSAPSGFAKNVEAKDINNVEVNFTINLLGSIDGLIFDPRAATAGAIPGEFTSPRTGSYEFFISIPVNPATGQTYTIQEILDLQEPFPSNAEQGIDMATRMAWKPVAGDQFAFTNNNTALTVRDPLFPNPGHLLSPRGQVGVPEPGSLLLLVIGLLALTGLSRRQRAWRTRLGKWARSEITGDNVTLTPFIKQPAAIEQRLKPQLVTLNDRR